MVEERQYRFSGPALEKLRRHLAKGVAIPGESFGNGRYVRNLVEQAIRNQAVRLLDSRYVSRDELMMLQSEDLSFPKKRRSFPFGSLLDFPAAGGAGLLFPVMV